MVLLFTFDNNAMALFWFFQKKIQIFSFLFLFSSVNHNEKHFKLLSRKIDSMTALHITYNDKSLSVYLNDYGNGTLYYFPCRFCHCLPALFQNAAVMVLWFSLFSCLYYPYTIQLPSPISLLVIQLDMRSIQITLLQSVRVKRKDG